MRYLQSLITVFRTLRLGEVALMTGFSFIGVLFMPCVAIAGTGAVAGVVSSIVLYVMAVYFLNSFADYRWDVKTERLGFVGRVSRSAYLWLLVLMTLLLTLASASVDLLLMLTCLGSLCLWCLYYLPPVRLKATFLLGTLTHFIGGMLHFHMGVVGFQGPDDRSIVVSAFFALLLSMGHANHEIMDHRADVASGIRTTAVRIGASTMRHVRTALAVAALIYWMAIYLLTATLSDTEFIVFMIPTATIAVLSCLPLGRDARQFQAVSRWLFLLAGIVLMLQWACSCCR